jgi:NodT family efflux transporter outer membrane factor (OMF) lipoprotein
MKFLPARFSVSVITLMLAGCALNEAAPPSPSADMPVAFAEATGLTNANTLALTPDWWRGFASDELSTLIARGLQNNPDLGMAAERIIQAQAQVRIAGASLFPVLALNGGISRRESRGQDGKTQVAGDNVDTGNTVSNSASTSGGGSTSLNLGLSASYEVDLWGQNAAARRSARFLQNASSYDRAALQLTLATGIASAYFQILATRDRLVVANENLAIAQRVLKVVDARVRNGAAASLDLARQRTVVLSQQVAIVPLQLQEKQSLYALAILLGQPPAGFTLAGTSISQLALPVVSPGLPASLLSRRPDLASAEAQLAAANANIVIARAALLPGITLTSSLGLASDSLHGLVSAPVSSFSLAAGLLQPIFNGGRLRSQLLVTQSRQRELLLAYRKVILAALADVDSALAATSRDQAQETLLQESLKQAELALHLSEVRYRAGSDDLLVLLDAQRSRFQAQDQLTQIRLARLQALLDVYKALGGGWEKPV